MNLVPRINKNNLVLFDATNGAIKKTMSLPGNATYSGPVVSGDLVTVSIHFNNGNNRSRTYNIKTGTLIRDLQM